MADDNRTTTRTEYALQYEYRKPPKGERPESKIVPMSLEKANQTRYALAMSRERGTVLRTTILTRTVTTTITGWEAVDDGA